MNLSFHKFDIQEAYLSQTLTDHHTQSHAISRQFHSRQINLIFNRLSIMDIKTRVCLYLYVFDLIKLKIPIGALIFFL